MARQKKDEKQGYGKLLDAWDAPDEAGEPVGCLTTSFTFSPVFFEEECLSRFLDLDSDPAEDGPVFLIEREEKMAQLSCAAALVDQNHCRGDRSLRWDLICSRLPSGIQHAKVSLLYWSNVCRLIIGSANMTENGYRRNLEVFGVLDFRVGSEAPISCLVESVKFLRLAGKTASIKGAEAPAIRRWNTLLDRVESECLDWGSSQQGNSRDGLQVIPVFSGDGYSDLFERLKEIWPGVSRAESASIVSPFFDPPEAKNAPVASIWELLRQRGEVTANFFVTAEEEPGEGPLFLNAPESLVSAQPNKRPGAVTRIFQVSLPEGRCLHAKGILLQDSRWILYLMGSSNFTSAGTGLGKNPNLEANLVYLLDKNRLDGARKLVAASFPEGQEVDLDGLVQWKPRSAEGEDEGGQSVLLPLFFADATYDLDKSIGATITLSFSGSAPPGWEITQEGAKLPFWTEADWQKDGTKEVTVLPWTGDRPPSGFWVRWQGNPEAAWWPVNVANGEALPPPECLKDLPLEVLMNILGSARPLHKVIQKFLMDRRKLVGPQVAVTVIDPHKKVDTSSFLLQRSRRLSWALNALRHSLEKPAVTLEFLSWRLHGPVGVMALANALVREGKSVEEKAFLLAELAMVLDRVRPESKPGYLPANRHRAVLRKVIEEISQLVPEMGAGGPSNLDHYVKSVFRRNSK